MSNTYLMGQGSSYPDSGKFLYGRQPSTLELDKTAIDFTKEQTSETVNVTSNSSGSIAIEQQEPIIFDCKINNKKIVINKQNDTPGYRKIKIKINKNINYKESLPKYLSVKYFKKARGTSPFDSEKLQSKIGTLTGTVSTTDILASTGEDISTAQDGSIKLNIDGQNAIISANNGILAPEILANMFSDSQATTLDVSNFDTSKVTNMSYMFNGSQATTLDVSNFDTSKVTNMSYMFSDSQATTLDVSNFDTSKVINMSYMFSDSQATTLDLSNFDTSKVINMSYMFSDSQATTLDLSNFDTSNVTDMRFMFIWSKATTLDLSNFDTSKVTNMASMFCGLRVTTLDLSNFNTSKVTNMSGMFNAILATILDVSNFDTSKVTDMSFMFCNSKTTILNLSNFDTSKVTDMRYMFASSKVTILDVSSFDMTNVTNTDNMFKYANSLTTVYCRSEADKQKMASSLNCPSTINFIVGKPQK